MTICELRHSRNIIDEHTILIFDEFISNENWEQDGYKALQDFCQESNLTYSVLAVSFFSKQVAVRVREQLSEPSRNKSCVASNDVQ